VSWYAARLETAVPGGQGTEMKEPEIILATDCGSTTTKAILIEKEGEEYRLKIRGEAPTTVEAPFDDVTIGAGNAITEVEELSGRKILKDGKVQSPRDDGRGVDLYLSTSSAGGGLQMMVTGVVRAMTAESAQRAALGAGAIVMDVFSVDDGRKPYQRIARIRHLRPDIVLLSGGIDGGTKTHVIEMAELLLSADPRPRFGTGFKLPVVYAGNADVREEIRQLIGSRMALRLVDNIRPELERENLDAARECIHDFFLEHVMSHAPGYDKLITWTAVPIMPTPAAVGNIVQTVAERRNIDVLAVDIGGATTDVFSVFDGTFNRTVSANLGMSYSICNVLLEAGIDNITRWLPFQIDDRQVRDRLRNKMIRPTTIPQTREDLLVEHGVSREALRLAFEHHKMLAVGLKGVQQVRGIADTFAQTDTGQSLVDMMKLELIVGSGGVLSHAPARQQAALMMLDAYQPEGITELAVDSIFMMPQLGVLASVHSEAATQVFERDCLIYLGTAIAPAGTAKKPGRKAADYSVTLPDGRTAEGEIVCGELKCLPLATGETAEITVDPTRAFDMGAGKGKQVRATVRGGVAGLILDGRGRPLSIPADPAPRAATMQGWLQGMDIQYG
jgi:uncharacterized protein (TIGR01319 family)